AGRSAARRRLASDQPIRAGNLTIRIGSAPTRISIERAGKRIQQLTLDPSSPDVSFLLGDGPLLGFGEGGPQFDRKGFVDLGRTVQAGYQLRTHGGRVPIQWFVSTDGWGMYVHQPLGA